MKRTEALLENRSKSERLCVPAMAALLLLGVMGITLTPHPVAAGKSVPVSVPVNVVNTPLPVTVDSARQPWQMDFLGYSTFTVPADRRLTIEYISVGCFQNSTTPPFPMLAGTILTTVANVGVEYFIPATYSGTGSGYDFYYGSLPVRIYADPGTEVIVNGICDLKVSGYLTKK